MAQLKNIILWHINSKQTINTQLVTDPNSLVYGTTKYKCM